MKSPVSSSNFGLRSEVDKVYDNLVPVRIQTQSNEERKQLIRLSVELIPVGLTSSSFRKVSQRFSSSDLQCNKNLFLRIFKSKLRTNKIPTYFIP